MGLGPGAGVTPVSSIATSAVRVTRVPSLCLFLSATTIFGGESAHRGRVGVGWGLSIVWRVGGSWGCGGEEGRRASVGVGGGASISRLETEETLITTHTQLSQTMTRRQAAPRLHNGETTSAERGDPYESDGVLL